ncbi:hypothetical protein, partial [Microbispora sp. ATCC PTA-5024]|uniref:hypothetical protein n=1 Tax=Microbispora sp. ATCC PTA-5024 TaxID=316330 RepID=UPI0003DBBD33
MTALLDRVGSWVRPSARRQVRDFVVLGAAGQVEAAMSLVATVVLVRHTGAEASGQVFLAQSLAALWFLVWDPRLGDAAQRFVPVGQAAGPGRGAWLFARLLAVDAVVGMSAAAVGAALVAVAHALGAIAAGHAHLLLLALAGQAATASRGTSAAGYAIAGRLRRLGALRMVHAVAALGAGLTGLLLYGPCGYLAAAALAGAALTITLAVPARRAVAATLGPVPSGTVTAPPGLLRFAVTTSLASSVALASDNGVLAAAGLLGGPALTAYLKIASAPARLFLGMVSTVTAQLYPRFAAAAVRGDGAAVRADALRATA